MEVRLGPFWTVVRTSLGTGMASTMVREAEPHESVPVRWAGTLHRRTPLELAGLVRSGSAAEAAVGVAAVNALLPRPAGLVHDENAFRVLADRGAGRRVAMIGRFPFADRLRPHCRALWVFELGSRRRPEDFSDAHAAALLPEAEVVAITATTSASGSRAAASASEKSSGRRRLPSSNTHSARPCGRSRWRTGSARSSPPRRTAIRQHPEGVLVVDQPGRPRQEGVDCRHTDPASAADPDPDQARQLQRRAAVQGPGPTHGHRLVGLHLPDHGRGHAGPGGPDHVQNGPRRSLQQLGLRRGRRGGERAGAREKGSTVRVAGRSMSDMGGVYRRRPGPSSHGPHRTAASAPNRLTAGTR